MDPYLEDPALWPEFHGRLVTALHRLLFSGLPVTRYESAVGRRLYAAGTAEHREDYLEIRERADRRLVTLLDVVSPANKTTDAGRQAYLGQRRAAREGGAYLGQRRAAREGGANLVEIDLVLQGRPTLDYSREGLPKFHYAVTVTRAVQPERYEIYTASLQKRLPRFRLPLARDDRDAVLDLQVAFTRCFDEGGYLTRIDYCREPPVPLGEGDGRWLDATLTAGGLRQPRPPQEEVALAAYYAWEREGRPRGRDLEHWNDALAQLRRQKGAD
jgi:hypothetical protein